MKHKHPSIYLSNLGLISSFLLTCLFSVSKCFSSFISWYFPRDLSALLGNSSPKTFSLLTHNQYILTSYTGGWLAWKTIVLFWEFPGGLVVRIPAFHCHAQVQSLNPWLQERRFQKLQTKQSKIEQNNNTVISSPAPNQVPTPSSLAGTTTAILSCGLHSSRSEESRRRERLELAPSKSWELVVCIFIQLQVQ